jgi:histidinol phosphatase-like enzyme (inositol monophosphatase family)
MSNSLRQSLDFAVDAVWQAGRITSRYFQTDVQTDWKQDETPVTIADREAELKLRKLIGDYYPDDGILGDEYGAQEGKSGYRWIIDPIDGTKSFVQGVPFYGVLLAREGAEGVDIGCVYMPALDEMVWAARGEGCWWNGRRARVSTVARLEDACICYTSWKSFAENGREDAWRDLTRTVRLHRGWGDCYGHILVATGRAEASFDPIMNPWDCGPLLPILEEAGGSFTDWNGLATIHGKDAFSSNGLVLEAVKAKLNG